MWNVKAISDSFSLSKQIDADKMARNDVIAEMIRRMIGDFKAHGMPVNSASRLVRYASLFDSSLVGTPSDELHSKLDIALLEILQFKTIHRSLNCAAQFPTLVTDIATATGGCLDPLLDKADSKARSTQFELFVWSCLLVAGFAATFGEPDLLVRVNSDRTLAIAAKRARSHKKILKNLRDGCHQIARSKTDGFVAIDLSFVESLSKPVYLRQAGQLDVLSKIVLDGFVRENMQEICGSASAPFVIGVLFHHSGVIRTIHDPTRAVSRRWLFLQTREPPLDQDTSEIIQRLQTLGGTNSQGESAVPR
jgi:hypothetical protein